MRRPPRIAAWLVSLVGLVTAATLASTPLAHANIQGSDLEIKAKLNADGMLDVSQRFSLQGTGALIQAIATESPAPGNKTSYRYDITDVAATKDGADVPVSVKRGKIVEISVPEASGDVEISYRVRGAALEGAKVEGQDQLTTLRWPFLQGLNVPVGTVTGSLSTPTPPRSVDCQSGDPAALQPCVMWQGGTHHAPDPKFEDEKRAAGDLVVFTVQVPADGVSANQEVIHHWSLDRSFQATGWPLLAALATLLIGGAILFALYRRIGVDQIGAGTPTEIARFVPIGEGQVRAEFLVDLAPGEVGTLADERVDPIDITATILDLATRGHLRITELPAGPHQPIDWTFERRPGRDPLRRYEETLLSALAPASGEPVLVSQIAGVVATAIPQVQDELYDEVVAQGWFEQRPDEARRRWSSLGRGLVFGSVVIAILLVIFTHLGLMGVSLVAIAVGVWYLAGQMPRRTEQGASVLAGIGNLAQQLAIAPTDQLPRGQEYEELSRLLPFAQVLGSRERWLAAFAAADNDPGVADPTDLDWYHAPETWHLADLPMSMTAFVTTLQGRLYDR